MAEAGAPQLPPPTTLVPASHAGTVPAGQQGHDRAPGGDGGTSMPLPIEPGSQYRGGAGTAGMGEGLSFSPAMASSPVDSAAAIARLAATATTATQGQRTFGRSDSGASSVSSFAADAVQSSTPTSTTPTTSLLLEGSELLGGASTTEGNTVYVDAVEVPHTTANTSTVEDHMPGQPQPLVANPQHPIPTAPAAVVHFEGLCHACRRGDLEQLRMMVGSRRVAVNGLGALGCSTDLDEDGVPQVYDTGLIRELVSIALEHSSDRVCSFLLSLVCPHANGDGFTLSWQHLGLPLIEASWVPFEFGNLTVLDLSHNKLRYIPAKILSLTPKLRVLNLSNNQLRKLPGETVWCEGGLPSLQSLLLHENQLVTVPAYVFQMGALATLSLAGNALRELPRSEPWACPNLAVVDLSRNRLASGLPEQLTTLESLRSLDVSSNRLKTLGRTVRLPKLRSLNASRNALTSVSGLAERLPALRRLNLSRNALAEVPDGLRVCTMLVSLDLSNNRKLTRLPANNAMAHLTQLSDVKLDGVPGLCLPRSVRAKACAVMPFVRARAPQSDVLDHATVVVTGLPGNGKTALCEALAGLSFASNRAPQALNQAYSWQHRPGGMMLGVGKPYLAMHTWQIASLEEYRALTAVGLAQATAHVIVWNLEDGTAGVDELRSFLLEIQAHSPNSPVVVVGAMYDKAQAELKERGANVSETMKHYRELVSRLTEQGGCKAPAAILEVSSKTGYGLTSLKDTLYGLVRQQVRGDVFGELPASHAAVGRFLRLKCAKMLKEGHVPLMPRADLILALNKELGVHGMNLDAQDIKHIVSFWHHEHLIYSYEDNEPELDLVFLYPPLLCHAIARIITDTNHLFGQGTVGQRSLQILIPEDIFPAQYLEQLCRLMCRLEFMMPIADQRYLVPALLPASAPPNLARIVQRNLSLQIRRRYLMDSVPRALWPAVIARLLACLNKTLSLAQARAAMDRELADVADDSAFTGVQLGSRSASSTSSGGGLQGRGEVGMVGREDSGSFGGVGPDDGFFELALGCCDRLGSGEYLTVTQSDRVAFWRRGLAFAVSDKIAFVVQALDHDYQAGKAGIEITVNVAGDPALCETLSSPDWEIQQHGDGQDMMLNVGTVMAHVVEHIDTVITQLCPGLWSSTADGGIDVGSDAGNKGDSKGERGTGGGGGGDNSRNSGDARPRSATMPSSGGSQTDEEARPLSSSTSSTASLFAAQPPLGGIVVPNVLQLEVPCPCTMLSGVQDRRRSSVAAVHSFSLTTCLQALATSTSVVCTHGDGVPATIPLVALIPDMLLGPLESRFNPPVPGAAVASAGEAGAANRPRRSATMSNGNVGGGGGSAFASSVIPDQGASGSPAAAQHWRVGSEDAVSLVSAGSFGSRGKMGTAGAMGPITNVPPSYCVGHFRGIQVVHSPVIVKRFKDWRLLRKEAVFLNRLKHPFIIAPLGAWSNPMCIAFERAAYGSLAVVLAQARQANTRLPWRLVRRMSVQMAAALQHIHSHGLVCHGLDPTSIVVCSLLLDAPIHVKVSDQCLLPPPGANRHARATPRRAGYLAPELIRASGQDALYQPASDVYAYGMVLYEVLTLTKPFEDKDSNVEAIFTAVLAGKKPSMDVLDAACVRSCMQELLLSCWNSDPCMRPTFADVLDRLGAPEFVYLRHTLATPKGQSFGCAASSPSVNDSRVWVSCGDTFNGQVVAIDVGAPNRTAKISSGFWVRSCRVTSVAVVRNTLWIGTQSGNLLEYALDNPGQAPTWSYDCSDSVLAITPAVGWQCVLTGLANGELLVFDLEDDDHEAAAEACTPELRRRRPRSDASCDIKMADFEGLELERSVDVMRICGEGEPIGCIEMVNGNEAWCGSVGTITCVDITTNDITATWKLFSDGQSDGHRQQARMVSALVSTPHGVWSCMRRDPTVCLWDFDAKCCLRTISVLDHVCTTVDETSSTCSATALLWVPSTGALWIGTKFGHILVVHGDQPKPSFQLFTNIGAIRTMIHVTDAAALPVVLVGGDNINSNALLWDAC
eukprot:m.173878 g.173878  ORF g.173878 m.173878 type:complete len:2021 (-) comp17880_c1_seq2:53-6115(-)